MSTACPLPIDWLDYLKGSRPVGATAHLAGCPACREALANLKTGDETAGDSDRWLEGIPLVEGKAWIESKPDEVVSGQIWFSASAFESKLVSYDGFDRLPLVVVNTLDPDDVPTQWLDVVPLWIDVENAGPTDVVIEPHHTDLGTSFRLLLSLQTTVAVEQLDGCIGAFTVAGQELLGSIWAGDTRHANFGAAFDSALDERLHSDAWIEDVVHQLGAYYAHWMERPEVAGDTSPTDAARSVLTFRIERVVTSKPMGLRLAADTAAAAHRLRAVVDTAGIVLHGYLTYRLLQEQLGFTVERAEGIPQPIRIVVHSRRIAQPITSEPFLPEARREYALCQGKAIFPDDVASMQLVLHNG